MTQTHGNRQTHKEGAWGRPRLLLVSAKVGDLHSIHQLGVDRASVLWEEYYYSSQSTLARSTPSWCMECESPTLALTNNSLGLPHAPSLCVCLFPWVCVMCVCFLPYLSFYLCCARCVFSVLIYIYNHLFVFIFPFLQILIDTYVTVPIDVRTTLLLCLSSFFHLHLHFSNSCVWVCKHAYACPSSSIFMHVYRHIHLYVLCSVLYL